MEDIPYRNACGHSDRENAMMEGSAAIRRAILASGDMQLIRLYSDVPEFHRRLHQEVVDETYPRLHELLRPLSQDDIDDALRAWNGDAGSKRAVVRHMKDHAGDRDTAAWLSGEYGGSEGGTSFIVRAGSPKSTELPWEEVQSRIAQLIQKDAFFTEAELDNFEDIDTAAVRRELESGSPSPFVEQVIADVERIAKREETAVQGDTVPKEGAVPERSRSIMGDPSNAPDTVDGDLWELITTDGGLLNDDERSLIFSWISDGDGTGQIALRLSELLAGNPDTIPLVTGETADFSSSMNGVEITILDDGENKKDAVPTRTAAEHYGIEVKRNGMACCPFHDDRTPSMKVDKRFHCFGCQEDGDVIDFVGKLFDLSPKRAAEKLAEDFGVRYEGLQTWQPQKRPSVISKLAAAQEYRKKENRCYRVLCEYLHLLRDWKEQYAPQPEDEDWHPLFCEALQKMDYVSCRCSPYSGRHLSDALALLLYLKKL